MDKGNGTVGLVIAALVIVIFIGVAYVAVNQSGSSVLPAPVTPPPGPNGQGTVTGDQGGAPPPPTPQDRANCEAGGGQWGIFGLHGEVQCNLPIQDVGKFCQNKADCRGLCVTDERAATGALVQGACYGWTVTTGLCLNTVEDGRAQGVICRD